MALPVTNQAWPPPAYAPINRAFRVWGAWHSGEVDKLAEVYYNLGADSPVGRSFFATTGETGQPFVRPGQYRGGLLGSIRRWFHGQPTPPGEKRDKYHVPLAGDIASTSSDLLFSEPLAIKAANTRNQPVLDGLFDDGMHATLLEAGDLASALGGVYLRVVWNTDITEYPWIDLVPADVAVPQFSYGKLTAVTFWRVISDDGKEVVRHLEKHVPGQNSILHGVYVGNQTDLGTAYPLTDFPETIGFASDLTDGNAITFPDQPLDASTVVYIPNMRPNRIWRDLGPQAAPLGRSDYQGVEGLMDGLDETMTSWMRDIQLAKARLIVPQQFLDNLGKGNGAVFDTDRRIYAPLQMMGTNGTSDIMVNQFAIRFAEHKGTADELTQQVIRNAGYSGQTFGEYDAAGGPITATEVEQRERRSLTTRGKKILYTRPGLRDILYGYLAVRREMFGDTTVEPERPDVQFPKIVLPNQNELANTASMLAQAEAASKQTLVQMMHPDWEQSEVDAEVGRIYSEIGFDLANRARVMLQEPTASTADFTEQAQQLAQTVQPPNLPTQIPGAGTAQQEG